MLRMKPSHFDEEERKGNLIKNLMANEESDL